MWTASEFPRKLEAGNSGSRAVTFEQEWLRGGSWGSEFLSSSLGDFLCTELEKPCLQGWRLCPRVGQCSVPSRTAFLLWFSCLLSRDLGQTLPFSGLSLLIWKLLRGASGSFPCQCSVPRLKCSWGVYCAQLQSFLSKTLVTFLFHRFEPKVDWPSPPSVHCVSLLSVEGAN